MLRYIKSQSHKLISFLFFVQFLIAVVSAVPFDLDNEDELPSLLSRAPGGLYVGSACTSNSQCYSDNCAAGNGTTKSTCQRQPQGGSCFANSNCLSRHCNKKTGTCTTPSNVFGICETFYDCDWYMKQVDCFSGVCKIMSSGACTKDSQCSSTHCIKGICRELPGPPNSGCHVNSECLSNDCASIKLEKCTSPDGSFRDCDHYISTCAGYITGHACSNNGECKTGRCNDGICSESQLGDSCVEQYQCGDGSLCSPDKKCYIPGNGTTNSYDACNSDQQCISKRCTTTKHFKDERGLNTFDSYDEDPTCDLLDNGESGCRSYRDCRTGLCKDGTCIVGSDGDRCVVNYQCEGICGFDGKCFTPAIKGDFHAGEICKDESYCLSNRCYDSTPGIERPSLDDPSKTVLVQEGECVRSRINGRCVSTADCGQGACFNGTCSFIAFGGPCTSSEQCASGTCETKPTSPDRGTCVVSSAFESCTSHDQCFSGACYEIPCNSHGCGYESNKWCDPVANGDTCRINADCGESASCSSDNKCVADLSRYCGSDRECGSNNCVDNVCKASTASSAASSTTSSTSTQTAMTTSTAVATTSTSVSLTTTTSSVATSAPTSTAITPTNSSISSSSSEKES